jgi:phage tail tape-measure protein
MQDNIMKSNLTYILETLNGDEQVKLSKEEKRAFMEAVKNFSAMGESVYGKGNLQELTERVRDIVEKAQSIALQDEGWFDKLTVNRHMKGLNESYKVFESTAKEMSQLQQRLSAAYEDIAEGLRKYYDVG